MLSPPFITTASYRYGIADTLGAWTTPYSFSTSAWTANAILYVPFINPVPYPIKRMFTYNGPTVAGNADIGIYSKDGSKLVSTGSSAMAGASQLQYRNASYLLQPGAYYLAYVSTNATGPITWMSVSLLGAHTSRMCGVCKQDSTFPLPDKATMVATTYSGIPVVGFTRFESGF